MNTKETEYKRRIFHQSKNNVKKYNLYYVKFFPAFAC